MSEIIVTERDLRKTYKSKRYEELAIKKYGHLLPLKPSKELAYIYASLVSDGFLDVRQRQKHTYYGYISYHSKFITQLDEFNKIFKKLFNKEGIITSEWGRDRFGESNTWYLLDSIICRLLVLSGAPRGCKTNKTFKIPNWILNNNKEIKSTFLKTIFTCEGYLSKDSLRIGMHKTKELEPNLRRFLGQIKQILKEYEINSHIIKKGDYIRKRDSKLMVGLNLQVKKRAHVIEFLKNINIDFRFKNYDESKFYKAFKSPI